MPPRATAELYRANQRRFAALLVAVRGEWSGMRGDWDSSWARVGPRIWTLVAAAQQGAAMDGANSVLAAVDDEGWGGVDFAGEVAPAAFAGVASDGRRLDTLLYRGVIEARRSGLPADEALRLGGQWLNMAVHTQMADAARDGASVAITSSNKLGYVRMVNPPCCQRCAVLAGKFFKWNIGFRRHPRCDCVHQPAQTSRDGYKADIGPDDVKDLTRAQRWAIDQGADMNAVINSHRANQRSQDFLTTFEGTGSLGGRPPWAVKVRNEIRRQQELLRNERVASARPGVRTATPVVRKPLHTIEARPTTLAIYRQAASREEAVRLLAYNGYIKGDISKVARMAMTD